MKIKPNKNSDPLKDYIPSVVSLGTSNSKPKNFKKLRGEDKRRMETGLLKTEKDNTKDDACGSID